MGCMILDRTLHSPGASAPVYKAVWKQAQVLLSDPRGSTLLSSAGSLNSEKLLLVQDRHHLIFRSHSWPLGRLWGLDLMYVKSSAGHIKPSKHPINLCCCLFGRQRCWTRSFLLHLKWSLTHKSDCEHCCLVKSSVFGVQKPRFEHQLSSTVGPQRNCIIFSGFHPQHLEMG